MRDPNARVQKNTTLTLDSESERMLQEIADQDELQPGNRSHTVRRLIRQEWKRIMPGYSRMTGTAASDVGPCKWCGTNGPHYCPHDVARD